MINLHRNRVRKKRTLYSHISSINPLCYSTVLISLNLALWSVLIYISFIWIQEESYTLHGINGPGRHQAERGEHTPTVLVCLFKLQMMGDGVFMCEGHWIWRRFCVKLQVLVHFTHIYTLGMLFTVRFFLADSLCFIHRRSSVWRSWIRAQG